MRIVHRRDEAQAPRAARAGQHIDPEGGVLAGAEEGIEVNLLGLALGVDLKEPALKLPGVGRVGTP